jgi:hypothetical protein
MNFNDLIIALASLDIIKLGKKLLKRKFIKINLLFHFINLLKQLKINILSHFKRLPNLLQLDPPRIINGSLQKYLRRLLALSFQLIK